MSDRKPLVIADGQIQQLQNQDDLDTPIEVRHARLALKFNTLVLFLATSGFDVPAELLEDMEDVL